MADAPHGIPAIESNLPLLMQSFGLTEKQVRELPGMVALAALHAALLAKHWEDVNALLNPSPPETRNG